MLAILETERADDKRTNKTFCVSIRNTIVLLLSLSKVSYISFINGAGCEESVTVCG